MARFAFRIARRTAGPEPVRPRQSWYRRVRGPACVTVVTHRGVRSAIPAATFIANAQRTRPSPAPPLRRRARRGPRRGGGPHLGAPGREQLRPHQADSARLPLHRRDGAAARRDRQRRDRGVPARDRDGRELPRAGGRPVPRGGLPRVHNACLDFGRKELRHQKRAAGSLDATLRARRRRRARTTPRSPPTTPSARTEARRRSSDEGPPPAGREPRRTGASPRCATTTTARCSS